VVLSVGQAEGKGEKEEEDEGVSWGFAEDAVEEEEEGGAEGEENG
jgi:hypothetical protein